MIEYLEYCLPIYCISNIIFRFEMFGEIPTVLIIATVVGLLFSWVPAQMMLDKFFKFDEKQVENLSYKEGLKYFKNTYDKENPITKHLYKRDLTKDEELQIGKQQSDLSGKAANYKQHIFQATNRQSLKPSQDSISGQQTAYYQSSLGDNSQQIYLHSINNQSLT